MKKLYMFFSVITILLIIFFNCQSAGGSGGGGGGGGGGDRDGTIPIDYNAMVTVPAINSFTMGYTGVATPVHTLTSPSISSFRMGKYEVTYERWYTVRQWAILPANGYTFANAGREGNDGTIGASPTTTAKNEPVTTINWRDSIVWCNAASQYEGLTPVYYTDAGFITPLKVSTNDGGINTTAGSEDNPYVNWSANGYRLPTEAEWEACARYQNGTTWTPGTYASGATADYNDAMATGLVAWYNANCTSTKDVGTKTANQLVIYDMSGNVWEWCWDWYGDYTTSSPYTDCNPKGHDYDPANPYRLIRGGSWLASADNLRSSSRSDGDPYGKGNSIGFRLSRTN